MYSCWLSIAGADNVIPAETAVRFEFDDREGQRVEVERWN